MRAKTADQLISRHSVLAQLKVRTKPQVTPPPSADNNPGPEQSVAREILNLKYTNVRILLFFSNLQNLTLVCLMSRASVIV